MTWALAILLGIIAIAAAIWAFLATRSQFSSMLVRIIYSSAVISAGAAVLAIVASVAGAPANDQNACQLAHVIAMTRHQPLYPDPTSGVLSAWTDGPLAAVLLAPSAIGAMPTTQIILGICLNLLVALVPTFLLLWQLAGLGHRAIVWPCLAMMLWWMTGQPSLNSVVFLIGADGLAIGLIVASIAFIMGPRDALRITCSAACLALACWTKLSVFPLVCIPLIYLAIVEDPSKAGLFAILFLGLFCAAASILIPIFGFKNMWFQIITLPLAQPWTDVNGQQVHGIERISAFGGSLLSFVHEARIPLAVLAAVCVLGQLLAIKSERSTLKTWLSANAWIMLPTSAIALVPGSLLAFLKMGRNPASFGLCGFLIAITAIAIAIRMYCKADIATDKQSSQLAIASICILLIWDSIGVLFTTSGVPALIGIIQNASANRQETALAFARQNPGQVYFPWNTLSSLLAEGQLYHSTDALRLRSWTGSTVVPTVAQITDHLPRNIRWIAIDASHSNEPLLRIFPRATARIGLPGLEGFAVYTEPGVGAPP